MGDVSCYASEYTIWWETNSFFIKQKKWTAEGITRFLRSKDTSIDNIVKASNDLLDDELDVYLPNKVIFVFELLCDRLGDNRAKQFRHRLDIWHLFNKTWVLLDSEPKLRNRTFQGLKFGEALAYSLNISPCSKEFLETITKTINLVRFYSTLNNHSIFDFSIEILAHYLELIFQLSGELEEPQVSTIIDDISSFFQAIVSAEKLSKKFTSNFASTALPSILKLSEERQQSYPRLLSIIKQILFTKETQENLIPDLKLLIKTKPSDGAIVSYYRIIIDTISKNDIESAEKMFTLITDEYPSSSEKLLEYLSSIKRTLSQAFLDTIVDKEFSKERQNWNLILSVLELDIEIGIKNAEKIMTSLETQDYTRDLDLGEQLVNCFIRARELVNFFELWSKVISYNSKSKWFQQAFTDFVSNNIHVLSFSQLKTLVEFLLSYEVGTSQLILLNTVVQGLFKTQDDSLVQKSKALFVPIWGLKEDRNELWYLKLQLLCLYEDILDSDGFETVIQNSQSPKCINHFYTLFRIREIYEFQISSIAASFTKYLKNSSSSEIYRTLFTRWFVLINTFFTNEQIEQIVGSMLAGNHLASNILYNELLFEQPRITEALISKVSKSLEKKTDTSFKIEILKLIPIQSYPKRLKPVILDQLVSHLLDKNASEEEKTLGAIEHILQTPTFKSKIESDIATIIKLSKKFPQNTIFERVWSHHVSQVKESISQEFIRSIVEEVTRSFSKSKSTKLSSTFYIALTILSNRPSLEEDKLSKLQAAFVEASKSLLNSIIGSKTVQSKLSEISWLLKVLYQLNLSVDDFLSLKPSIQKFGKQLGGVDSSSDVEASIFLFFSKFSNTSGFTTEYFEALYIVLRDSGVSSEKLLEALENVISKLPEEEFLHSFNLLAQSFDDDTSILYLVEILSVYWKQFDKKSDSSVKLFVKSLSTVVLHFKKISNSQALIHIINACRTILVEKTWIVSQYALELIITLLSVSADSLLVENNECSVSIYTSITLALSNILLLHRYRLSNRHHITLSLFKSLLVCLTKRQRTDTNLSDSIICAEAFSRVLTNLCEPSQHSFRQSKESSLSSSTSDAKRSLRKYLPVLLLSYIYFALKYSFDSRVREALLPGIFNIFDVLSQDELVLVSTSLDYSGRTYYRSLYEDYKKIGKWRTD